MEGKTLELVVLFTSLGGFGIFFGRAFWVTWVSYKKTLIVSQHERKVHFAEVLQRYLTVARDGIMIDVCTGLCSILSAVCFVLETYLKNSEGTRAKGLFFLFEIAFANYFFLNWCLQLAATSNAMHYIFSADSLIDICTCLPVYISCAFGPMLRTPGLGFLRTLKIFRVTRLVRVLRTVKPVTIVSRGAFRNPVQLRMLQNATLCTIAVLVISGMVLVLSDYDDTLNRSWDGYPNMYFHDAFYYVLVTMSTVGYGDISPTTPWSRLVISLLLLGVMSVIPYELSRLSELVSMANKAANHVLAKEWSGHHVVIVCDSLSLLRVHHILRELFHEDRGFGSSAASHAVVLMNEEPNDDWKSLTAKYPVRLTVLTGNVFNMRDMERACVATAVGIFILAAASGDVADKSDNVVLRAALAVRNMKTSCNNRSEIFIQVMTEEYWQRLVQLGFNPFTITCFESLRRSLMTSTCVCPGVSTLIQNSIVTLAPSDVRHGLLSTGVTTEPTWYESYIDSMENEFYSLPITEYFHGWRVRAITNYVFENFGVIILAFGINVTCLPGGGYGASQSIQIHLGSGQLGNYVVNSETDYGYAIVVAPSQKEIIQVCEAVESLSSIPECPHLESAVNAYDFHASESDDEETMPLQTVGKTDMDVPALPQTREDTKSLDLKSVIRENKANTGHIVIVCWSLHGMTTTVRALRSSDTHSSPIAVLCPFSARLQDVDSAALDLLSETYANEEVYVVRGVDEESLVRVGVHESRLVILLAADLGAAAAVAEDRLTFAAELDGETLRIAVDVLRLTSPRKTRVVVELSNEANVYHYDIVRANSSVAMQPSISSSSLELKELFQSRKVVGAPKTSRAKSSRWSLFPNQRSQDPSEIEMFEGISIGSPTSGRRVSGDLWNHLKERWHSKVTSRVSSVCIPPVPEPRLHKSYATGDVVLVNFTESLLVSAFFTPEISSFFAAFFSALDGANNSLANTNTSIAVLSVKALCKLGGIKSPLPVAFGDLFAPLLSMNMLAFAARKRMSDEQSDFLSGAATLMYSMMSPRKDLLLHADEQVFVFYTQRQKLEKPIHKSPFLADLVVSDLCVLHESYEVKKQRERSMISRKSMMMKEAAEHIQERAVDRARETFRDNATELQQPPTTALPSRKDKAGEVEVEVDVGAARL